MEERATDIGKKRESIDLIIDDIFDKNLIIILNLELANKTIHNLEKQVDGKEMLKKDSNFYTDDVRPKIIEIFPDYVDYELSILYDFYIEQLPFDELCNLFIYMINTISIEDDEDKYTYIRKYVMKHNINVPSLNINCFIIHNKELSDYIFMINDTSISDKNIWNYADELTITRIKDIFDSKYIIPRSNTNSIFGFNYIKSTKDKRNINKGIKIKLDKTSKSLSIVAQSIEKKVLISIFGKIDDKLNNDDFLITYLKDDIKTIQRIIIVMEMVLRYKDKTSENRYFLTMQEALYNANSKYLNLL